MLLLAAAEPLGDPLLLVRAAARLGLSVESADPAEEAGLFQIRERCSFRHPLVRSAVYGAATPGERRLAHGALAEATDPELDPDRRAWHRAQATPAPDEEVATELERTAARAKARGGLAAAGAFLERAAMLTPDAGKRAERALAAAEVMYEAGAYDSVEDLLRYARCGASRRASAGARRAPRSRSRPCRAAGEEESDVVPEASWPPPSDSRSGIRRSRTTHTSRRWRTRSGLRNLRPSRPCPMRSPQRPASGSSAAELLFRGWAQLLEQGYPAGTDLLRQAMIALRDKPELEEPDLSLLLFTEGITRTYWDLENWETLARRTVQLARDVGALQALPRALGTWVNVMVATGDLPAAATALAEAEAISEVTGENTEDHSAWLDAWRFDELRSAHTNRYGWTRGPWSAPPVYEHARAVVYNAAGRYEAALAAAERSCELHPTGMHAWALIDLVEAAVRCGQHDRAGVALAQLTDRTRLVSTEWGLGLEARCAALVADEHRRRGALRRSHRATRPCADSS